MACRDTSKAPVLWGLRWAPLRVALVAAARWPVNLIVAVIALCRCAVQLVDDAGGVAVLPPGEIKPGKRQGVQYIDEAAVQQELGVTPGQVSVAAAMY